MTTIGIFIMKAKNIFSNGCIQQAYFLLKTIRKTGREADLITIEDDYDNFTVVDEPIINVSDIENLKKYSIVIFSSLIVHQEEILNNMRRLGIKIINHIVGNYYFLNCEEFVFGHHEGVLKNLCNEYVDEIWLMPMYAHVKNYIRMLTNRPVKISPYVWDQEIIQTYIDRTDIKVFYKEDLPPSKICIIIMEANLSIHKCTLPLLCILNQYFLEYPDRLGEIHVIAKPTREGNCLDCISHLEIVKCNKVTVYPRCISLEIYNNIT